MLEAKNKNTLSVAGTTNSVFSQGGVVSGGHNFHVYYTIHYFCFARRRYCTDYLKNRGQYNEQ